MFVLCCKIKWNYYSSLQKGHFRPASWQDVKGVHVVLVLHETISLPVTETEMCKVILKKKRKEITNVKFAFRGTALHSYTPVVNTFLF